MKDLQTQENFPIEKSKGKYSQISSKLSDISNSSKTYWFILKSFLVGKKIPYIPPLYEYITNFKKKLELFNSFFANQCPLINNKSQFPPTSSYKTNERLFAKLDSNKAHGHDKDSICMIKTCQTIIAHFQSLHRQ